MEPREDLQVRVGIFVFSGLLIAMVIVFFLGGQRQLFQRQTAYKAHFDEVGGLRVGASVLLAGVRVGVVDKISFATVEGGQRVSVRLQVRKEYRETIRADSRAAIETQGLLGDKLVAVTQGSLDQPVVEEGGVIPVEERSNLFALADSAAQVLGDIDRAAKAVARLLEGVEGGRLPEDLKGAARELREILQTINRGEGTLGALVKDPSLYYDVRRLLGKVERNRLLRSVIRSRLSEVEKE